MSPSLLAGLRSPDVRREMGYLMHLWAVCKVEMPSFLQTPRGQTPNVSATIVNEYLGTKHAYRTLAIQSNANQTFCILIHVCLILFSTQSSSIRSPCQTLVTEVPLWISSLRGNYQTYLCNACMWHDADPTFTVTHQIPFPRKELEK